MRNTLHKTTQDGSLSQPHALRDILIVGAPIVTMGVLGNLIGGSTLLGGAVINLGYVLMVIIGSKLLGQQASSWLDLGLKRPASWFKTILLGLVALVGALFLFVATQNIAATIIDSLGVGSLELDQSRFNPIQSNLPLFALMIVLAWTTIAFGEEMFYRAFLITRMLDFTQMGQWSAILIAGLIFGLVHFAEGPVGILANASFGVLFGWIYIRSGFNLWITIIAHGMINTLRFTLLFMGVV
jgi:hypothetical protein